MLRGLVERSELAVGDRSDANNLWAGSGRGFSNWPAPSWRGGDQGHGNSKLSKGAIAGIVVKLKHIAEEG